VRAALVMYVALDDCNGLILLVCTLVKLCRRLFQVLLGSTGCQPRQVDYKKRHFAERTVQKARYFGW